jgi:hypothetical protein
MPAQIIAPRQGDTITIPTGGSVSVHVLYSYPDHPTSTLRCFVDADADADSQHANNGLHVGNVTSTKPIGVHVSVNVQAKTNGIVSDTQTITLVVVGSMMTTTVERTHPPTTANCPAPGHGPIGYRIRGPFDPKVKYLVCVAHELTADPTVAPVPVDGVTIVKGPNATEWRCDVTIPNALNRAYIARVIEFDAFDRPLRWQTAVLQ